ncbi:heavy-metal-associated domain-containing protein [Kordia zhangzhouensis]|uniref:heavy-metal-associated domain-containing protein n=1 Tax=Kordia zhangzhouensis TaxID=1620405 RepID=UPI00062921C9|nr:heavy metal-associated domain-containing protein [Kordia zhangzhouensis]
MKQTYTVTGMTCNGCRTSVEDTLNALAQVKHASVNLETSEAIVESENKLDISVLQKALPEKYTIQPKTSATIFESVATDQKEESELKQLFPLFLIFFYITTASILLQLKNGTMADFMLDFMGLFYIVFSFFKFLDYKGFPESFQMYDPLAKRVPIYGWVYPFIEVGLGLLFLFRFELLMALILTIVILGITTIGVTRALFSKKAIQCACLGTALKLPMTKATFIENSIMLIMAIWMITTYI